MGILKLTKGLFAVKDTPPADPTPIKKEEEKINFQDYGQHQAFMLGGSTPGLRVCLQKVYYNFKERIKDDHGKQEELKRPARVSLEEQKGKIEGWQNRIKTLREESIPATKEKIETLKQEQADIRRNPQEVIGDVTGKASFYIGAIILLFLTLYLFTFYSSASYSAFFKEFSLNQIGVASSIFDAQALSKAMMDGVMELVLILTVPFVFLGLGYLIHKIQEEKGIQKFGKIGVLILVTFVFDAILAYEITEKIYNIRKSNSFGDMPEYTIAMALNAINFWLIIFAGFVVYLIWGFVFDFVLAAFGKLDKVKVVLRDKERQIEDAKKQIEEMQRDIEKMGNQIDYARSKVKALNETLNNTIIPREFEVEAFAFMTGWLAWMKGSGKTSGEMEEASTIVHEFVRVAIYNYPTITNE